MPKKQSIIKNSRSLSSSFIESANHKDKLFKRKQGSIREYMNLLEDDPQEASLYETQCERNFYKAELKTAIAINFSLVKLIQDKETEICSLLTEISQQRKQNHSNESSQKSLNNENSQLFANRTALTPKKHIKRAFEAQKQILGAKYSQQKEEYRRKLERKEEMLKSSKEQNLFLHQKLIEMGEKIASLQRRNHQLRVQVGEIQKVNSLIGPEYQTQIHPRVLNFSPIQQREEDNKISIEEISFNQTPEKHQEPSLSPPQNKPISDQGMRSLDLINQARETRYYEQLQRQYGQLKEQMLKILQEVEQYRTIIKQLQIHYEDKAIYRQEASSIVSKPVDELQTRNQQQSNHWERGEGCSQCLKLQMINQDLYKDLQRTREDLAVSKVKVERALALGRKHQEEWSVLLDEGEPVGND